MRLTLTFLLIALVTFNVLAFAQEHAAGHEWAYEGAEGPKHWGDIKTEYATCKVGKQQSPVDIKGAQKATLPAIQFNYQPVALHIIDNGHTIQVNYPPGSTISVGGKQYQLQQFHFHKPSEEAIAGKHQDMVAHLVHADAEGNLAVVAVLLSQGNSNEQVDELWKNLPKEKEKESTPANVTINAFKLLPIDRSYYTFSGSLTTPPCSEKVTWFVLKSPTTVSKSEIDQFGKIYPHNARPTQPLNGRMIQESN
jgi:carbonic anhydrase